MMVLGASGLGAPLSPSTTSDVAAAPNVAPAPPIPPPQPSAPGGERTLRSVQGPQLASAALAPQGYVLTTTVMPEIHAPAPRSGPRTQVAGIAPPVPSPPSAPSSRLAPGESILVVAAPPPPRRRHTLPGTDISLVPLLAVGALFAAIGVGITLWFMLGNPDAIVGTPMPAPTVLAPITSPTAAGTATGDGDLDLGQRGAHPGLHATPHTPPHAPVPPRPPVHPTKVH